MKPKIVIVNSQDNILTSMERDALAHDDIYRVSALWLTNSRNQVLLAQRKRDKKHDPGKWGPAVAGTVDEGETYESNIYKEAEEGVGLAGKRFELGPKHYVDDGLHKFFCQWYITKVDRDIEDFMPQKDEVEKLAWIDADELTNDIERNSDKYVSNAETWKELA